jgi:DNA-binding transcriptional MerR regulator
VNREAAPVREERLYRIGEVGRLLGLSADTLRYYERIGLLPRVARRAGVRRYSERDLSRLRFVQRAQRMNFTLTEIGALLRMREAPARARREVRALTARKLAEVEAGLQELDALRRELTLLLNLCAEGEGGCPILAEINEPRA